MSESWHDIFVPGRMGRIRSLEDRVRGLEASQGLVHQRFSGSDDSTRVIAHGASFVSVGNELEVVVPEDGWINVSVVVNWTLTNIADTPALPTPTPAGWPPPMPELGVKMSDPADLWGAGVAVLEYPSTAGEGSTYTYTRDMIRHLPLAGTQTLSLVARARELTGAGGPYYHTVTINETRVLVEVT